MFFSVRITTPRWGGAEMDEWRCSMLELHELEARFADAGRSGDRELTLKLRAQVDAQAVHSDLLLARAVAAVRARPAIGWPHLSRHRRTSMQDVRAA